MLKWESKNEIIKPEDQYGWVDSKILSLLLPVLEQQRETVFPRLHQTNTLSSICNKEGLFWTTL